MLRDLQAVQGTALADEMTKSGKKTAVQEQSYGETYMKTTVLTKDAIGDQMFADASGEKKMKIGKGASAGEKPAGAVSDKPAGTTKPAAGTTTKPAAAANTSRVLQDANATKAANATAAAPANTDWKKLKGEDEYMRVVVNEKMFLAGGPLANSSRPIIMFNKHGADFVKDFPRGKKGTFDPATGKKINKTAAVATLAAAAGVNVTDTATVEEGDDELDDTVAQQVMELEFIDGTTMEKIKVAGL